MRGDPDMVLYKCETDLLSVARRVVAVATGDQAGGGLTLPDHVTADAFLAAQSVTDAIRRVRAVRQWVKDNVPGDK